MNKVEEDISCARTVSFRRGMKLGLGVEEDTFICQDIPTQKRGENSPAISRNGISELKEMNIFKAF